MTQVWHHWHRVWIYVVLLIPVAVLAAVALRALRPSGSWRRSVAEVGMVLGTLPWLWMIMTPMELPPHATTVYLVPFSDLWDSLTTENAVPIGVQVGGNLLVLLALGFFAPIRFAAMASLTRLGVLGLAFSLTVELVQHAFVSGRVFSVDDVLLNAAGCVVGGLLSRPWWSGAPTAPSPAS
ncbi:VanZ family protein [Rhizocola hellebori]|uniref:VanZ family protein n=1 Tax=Rhizocola hellebori TaxID=1392758 RepID=UPI001943CDDF|nr:VanZ family protein [Rhizocola hellebori]